MNKSRRRPMIRLISYLCAVAAAFGILAGTNYERALRAERETENHYQHAFSELVTAMTEVDAALQKSVYATSPAMTGNLCTEIFGKAMTAQMSLGALPYGAQELEQTAGFISRVGDYAYALSRAAAGGDALSEDELANLQGLSETASVLTLNLKSLQSDLQAGRLTLRELERAQQTLDGTEEETVGSFGESFRLIEQEFPEVPSLIYDGPFSEHLTGAAPKALEGLSEVTEDAARETAAGLLGVGKAKVYATGETAGELPCYTFAADADGGASYFVSVTKQGGAVLSMLSSRPVGSAAVSAEEAVATAARFLQDAGYLDMAETYYMTQGGILTVNFAWQQDGVLCYSDLVKVSVALDTGAVCAFESRGYLTAHCVRTLPEVAVSTADAQAAVPSALRILAHQMALVPSDGQYETLCHEFKCANADGRHCIIYVNAVSGAQEKILLLLEDESGTLTI
ncbi:MAG: germination protein YpeB [Oscillospiraceae bacterium]|nr:germination protein YpeB [Oscillospiraceae bacterium]